MALVCNIDQTGRSIRYRIGVGLVCFGILAGWVTSRFSGGLAPWLVGGLLVAGGLFAWFEASRGWCAVRALGFKTRV